MRVKTTHHGTIEAPKATLNLLSIAFDLLSHQEYKRECETVAGWYEQSSNEIYIALANTGYYNF